MDCSTPGFPVHHQLPEFTQTHVHWVDDTIQPSHPLSSPFPSALNLSQHQGVPMSCFFASSGQSIKASASVLPVNIQGWFPLGIDWFDLLAVQGLSTVFSSTTVWKHSTFDSLVFSFLYSPVSHPYMTTVKTTALTIQSFVSKVISLFFNTVYRFVIAFLPRSKRLLISWL